MALEIDVKKSHVLRFLRAIAGKKYQNIAFRDGRFFEKETKNQINLSRYLSNITSKLTDSAELVKSIEVFLKFLRAGRLKFFVSSSEREMATAYASVYSCMQRVRLKTARFIADSGQFLVYVTDINNEILARAILYPEALVLVENKYIECMYLERGYCQSNNNFSFKMLRLSLFLTAIAYAQESNKKLLVRTENKAHGKIKSCILFSPKRGAKIYSERIVYAKVRKIFTRIHEQDNFFVTVTPYLDSMRNLTTIKNEFYLTNDCRFSADIFTSTLFNRKKNIAGIYSKNNEIRANDKILEITVDKKIKITHYKPLSAQKKAGKGCLTMKNIKRNIERYGFLKY